MKIGDSEIEFDSRFRLYISTKLPNPSLLPEIFIRVSVLNFTVTELGLEEQLLADVVNCEMPSVESAKNELIVEIATGKNQLKKNEDRILELLTSSKGMILDDVELIENLKLSKATSEIVKVKVSEAEVKKVEIEQARGAYKPVAERGAILFFVIADLALIDPMYQFSLAYFSRLYNAIILAAEKSDDIASRIVLLITAITSTIFFNICRGLFNDHKRIFSFLVAATIAVRNGDVAAAEWSIFCRGAPIAKDKPSPLPAGLGVSEKIWKNICSVATGLPAFAAAVASFKESPKDWEAWINSAEPFLAEQPKQFKQELTHF